MRSRGEPPRGRRSLAVSSDLNRAHSIRKLAERLRAERETRAARVVDESARRRLSEVLARHGRAASQIIAILQDVQGAFTYLSEPALRFISDELAIPLTRLYGIATFYRAFRLAPRGRHEISLCMGTACHVRGAERVKDAIERRLGIGPGGATEDMRFSFETVRCLGCCGQAPVMTVDEDLVGKLDHLSVGTLLEKYE
jgi:NADH-quinone oxidoreductase subunit E